MCAQFLTEAGVALIFIMCKMALLEIRVLFTRAEKYLVYRADV